MTTLQYLIAVKNEGNNETKKKFDHISDDFVNPTKYTKKVTIAMK